MSPTPIVTVYTHTNVARIICSIVNFDEVVDVIVSALHIRAFENVNLRVNSIVHKLNVNKSLVRRLHIPTQHTRVDALVFYISIIFIITHKMLPIGSCGHAV